jgi:signal transduction histidine kinase
VLFNLLSNACKFTRQGVISLDVARRRAGGGREWLTVRVADTGIGIRPEQVEKLFQPFTQAGERTAREYGGTGLGLSISRELTRLLGGEIRVTSEPGKGSSFTLYLPLSDEVSALAA